jgi:hypothetical protein
VNIILKRWLLLTAMGAMVLVSALSATAVIADTETSQNVGEVVTQETNSESESADMSQSFDVTSSGDNANQCTGLQGVGNTAPVTGNTNILQYNAEADDFDFEDIGGSSLNILQADAAADKFEFDGKGDPLTIGGTNETACEQGDNQAASASD